MKRVTRAVQPEDLRPLLERPPRATLAVVQDGRIQVRPVAFRYEESRYFVGLRRTVEPPHGRVKLLIDDGFWYFDLRGLWIRGRLTATDAPANGDARLAWFELTPAKIAAWHYGSMREA